MTIIRLGGVTRITFDLEPGVALRVVVCFLFDQLVRCPDSTIQGAEQEIIDMIVRLTMNISFQQDISTNVSTPRLINLFLQDSFQSVRTSFSFVGLSGHELEYNLPSYQVHTGLVEISVPRVF